MPIATPSTSVPIVSTIPTPSSAERAALLQGLRAINPGITQDEDRAVSRSRSTCADIRQAKDEATIVRNTKLRFEGGSAVPTLTEDQAAAIVAAVRASFCG